jgi:hypothetical protein
MSASSNRSCRTLSRPNVSFTKNRMLWATSLATAIVVSGIGMALLGLFVAARFTEHNFIPTREKRWSASLSIFRLGVSLSRRDHEILLIFVATMLINGAAIVGWLFPKQLVNLGFPSDPVLWYGEAWLKMSGIALPCIPLLNPHNQLAKILILPHILMCLPNLVHRIHLLNNWSHLAIRQQRQNMRSKTSSYC